MVYGDIDEELTAERQIRSCRQTTSVGEYAARFQQINSHLTWSESAQAAQFYYGLKDIIKDDIAHLDKRPENVPDMIQAAVRIDNRLYERRMEKGGHRDPATFTPRQPKQGNQGQRRTYPSNYYGPRPTLRAHESCKTH